MFSPNSSSHFCRTPWQSVRPPVDPQSWWFTMPPWMHLCSELWKSLTPCCLYSHDIPLQDISVRWRPFIKSACNKYYWSGLSVYVKNYCILCTTFSMPNLCATNPTDFSSNFQFLRTLEFHIHGFHREAPSILQSHLDSSHCWSSLRAVTLHPTHNTITSLQLAQLLILHVFSSMVSKPCHFWLQYRIIYHFLQSLRYALDMKLHFTSGYHAKGDGQTEWTNQTLEQYLQVYCNYQQTTGPDPSISWVRLQQYSKCHYQHYTLLCQQGLSFIQSATLHPHMLMTLVTDSMSYTNTEATYCQSPM